MEPAVGQRNAMAVVRDRPYVNSNFLVEFDGEDSGSLTAGFAEVVFPAFTIRSSDGRRSGSKPSRRGEASAATEGNRLVLKRGVIGTLDLYSWWNSARRRKGPRRRTVKVELLGDDHSTVVMTWHFRDAYPVTLSYSPLSAMDGSVVMETVELAFDRVEMS